MSDKKPSSTCPPPVLLHEVTDIVPSSSETSDTETDSPLALEPNTSTSPTIPSFPFAKLPLEIREMIWKLALPNPRVFPFNKLPLEIREMIWTFALPDPRVFRAFVWVSFRPKIRLLNRSELKMPLAHVCFEARRVVRQAGYVLRFRNVDQTADPGVWFHPTRDEIELIIWRPGYSRIVHYIGA